ncbi:hypothetical protein GGR43_004360 [Sphingobium jiangsuense]|uniref:Uncharacterized protein n=1 Tax=Sphingobium jiangsuense TaxID=870476 RepID=A0A7W6BRA0_9SPHN|nr:hypothetical protein [Sphingobium jiangsuense]MBB3928615.1 hypothetical protein [Sphingobium jiangsuense]
MPDLLDAGPSGLVHAEIGKKVVKVGNLALAADKSRDAPLVIFLEHDKSRFFSECAPANLRAELPLMLVFFFSFFVRVGLTTMRTARDQRVGDLQDYGQRNHVIGAVDKFKHGLSPQ